MMNYPTFDLTNSNCRPIFRHWYSRALGFVLLVLSTLWMIGAIFYFGIQEAKDTVKYDIEDIISLFKYTFCKWI